MNTFNFSLVEGVLKDDPEVYSLDACTQYCEFKIVNDQGVFDIVTLKELADTCMKYLKKGSRVMVGGKLRKDEDLMNTFIEGKEVNFLPSKPVEVT